MYPITNEVKALFEAEQRKVLRITGTDKNGAVISITDNDVIADSFQVDRYSCNGEKLEVGTAIAAQMSLTLENGGGQYNGIVFEGAELFVEVGIADWTQSSPTITYVPCGYFTPDEQPRRLSTISITGLDRMTKFDVVVDAAALTFPATVAGLVGQVCTLCGVTLAQSISGLVNAGVNVAELPTAQEEITYRNLIQWCAGVMGTNAWFDWNGQLRFSWYANTTGYVSTVGNRYSSDLYEDDLTVSGIEYTNDSGIVIVEGTDDYAIDLTGNAIAGPLVATVLPPLNTALNGFTYRPFTAATVNAPYLWPMDIVTFTDKDGNNHTSVLTNVAFGLNGTTAMESKGMTYAINKLAQPKGFTREQAQLVTQAMEHVEQDIDESLTQQEIFNRLTDDGAAQGLLLYNGQLYINASYINAGYLSADRLSGGTIDGTTVTAKLLNIVDANGNVIASFNSAITLGKQNDAHAEMDFNSFEIYDKAGDVFFSAGDNRNASGTAEIQDTFSGDGTTTQFTLSNTAVSGSIVTVKQFNPSTGTTTTQYINAPSNNIVTLSPAPAQGIVIYMTYNTSANPIYHYDFGKRASDSYVGNYSVVEGYGGSASGNFSHAEGVYPTASGEYSHAEGQNTIARGNASHAEGAYTTASGKYSHAEGNQSEASGKYSHAEGYSTTASGEYSHAEGYDTTASSEYSHAEGRNTTASARSSHAEGADTTASGRFSHAEGRNTTASGDDSHAEGSGTTASYLHCHAEGAYTTASGIYSHAEGHYTEANHLAQHVFGEYNEVDDSTAAASSRGTYVEIVGNGSSSARSNARTLDWNGNEYIAGALSVGNAAGTRANLGVTPANIGAKAVQSAVSDPTASGTAVAFIDSISQNAQGVISPTKKTVQSASQSAAGLMSAADKTKLDGIAAGAAVTGVKGNAESSYRTGNVNLTPANIGAAADSAAMQYRGWYPNGQSMLSLTPGYYRTSPNNLPSETFPSGINAYGTLCVDNTGYTHITYIGVLGDFMIWESNTGHWYVVQKQGKVLVSSGGTGATTAAAARTNLEITPANIGAVAKSGDTMTGTLTIESSWPTIYLRSNSSGTSQYATTIQASPTGQLSLIEYKNGSRSETYSLPTPTNDAATQYYVLTTKSPVTIPEGGTGATTPAGARTNLGIATTVVTVNTTGITSSGNWQSDLDPANVVIDAAYCTAGTVAVTPYCRTGSNGNTRWCFHCINVSTNAAYGTAFDLTIRYHNIY